MRAQNEPAENVVRLVRGELEGRPDPDVPGAWHVERLDEQAFAEGRIWPQSRGSQLAGLAVGAREGERTLDVCAAPGGKATQLARRGRRGRAERGPGARAGGELPAARRRERHGRLRRRVRLPPELTGFDRALVDAPCSGPRRARRPSRPALALGAAAGAPARAAARGGRAGTPGGTLVYSVCTMNADETEAVVDASGLEVDGDARRGVAGVPPPAPARVPADAAARPRHERLLHRPLACA